MQDIPDMQGIKTGQLLQMRVWGHAVWSGLQRVYPMFRIFKTQRKTQITRLIQAISGMAKPWPTTALSCR